MTDFILGEDLVKAFYNCISARNDNRGVGQMDKENIMRLHIIMGIEIIMEFSQSN